MLTNRIDTVSIASKTGMKPDQVNAGMHEIAPVLSNAIENQNQEQDSETINLATFPTVNVMKYRYLYTSLERAADTRAQGFTGAIIFNQATKTFG